MAPVLCLGPAEAERENRRAQLRFAAHLHRIELARERRRLTRHIGRQPLDLADAVIVVVLRVTGQTELQGPAPAPPNTPAPLRR